MYSNNDTNSFLVKDLVSSTQSNVTTNPVTSETQPTGLYDNPSNTNVAPTQPQPPASAYPYNQNFGYPSYAAGGSIYPNFNSGYGFGQNFNGISSGLNTVKAEPFDPNNLASTSTANPLPTDTKGK